MIEVNARTVILNILIIAFMYLSFRVDGWSGLGGVFGGIIIGIVVLTMRESRSAVEGLEGMIKDETKEEESEEREQE